MKREHVVKKYRVLFVDVGAGSYRVEEYELKSVAGPVELGVRLHLERYRSWATGVFDPRNVVVFGSGLFAGSRLFGSHRLVFVFRSPVSLGLHVSAMGGAGYQFLSTGVDAVVVEGWAGEPTGVVIRGGGRGFEKVELVRISSRELWRVYQGYRGWRGVRALVAYIYDHVEWLAEMPRSRVAVVGPSAFKTLFAGIFSPLYDPRSNRFQPGAFDSASRGGGGSVLARAHNVVAIGFGGSYVPEESYPVDTRELDELSRNVLGKPYGQAVTAATVKYRFDPRLGTGGTFGVNYVHYRDLIPAFGFNTIYLSRTVRLQLLENILEHFWKPFQHEVFESKQKPWHTCGEPCPAVCKKVWRGVKVDYEPFNALGPLIGVLRLEDAKQLVELVDDLGLDAIEAGHIVAWLLEAVYRGLLEPGELGLDAKPCFDPVLYDVEKCSNLNRELAEKIITGIVDGRGDVLRLIAGKGLRTAARELSSRYRARVESVGRSFEDLAVYAAFGEDGYMTPNLYWAPGMVAPMYVLGRYWTNYAPTFMEPEDHAESSLKRAISELAIDNAGFCRFHRGWAEKLLKHLYSRLGLGDPFERAAKTYALIARYQELAGAEPRPWESRKTIDIVASMASEVGVEEWTLKFAKNLKEAAHEWWNRFKSKIDEKVKAYAAGEGSGSHPPT